MRLRRVQILLFLLGLLTFAFAKPVAPSSVKVAELERFDNSTPLPRGEVGESANRERLEEKNSANQAKDLALTHIPAAEETLLRIDVAGRGIIKIQLYTKEAPKTTAHIIDLVKSQFYDGQKFYRVVNSPRPYLVQFGAPDSRTKSMDDPDLPHQGSGTKVPFENSGHSNDAAGVVGLSTQQGDKDSGDSQFYILLAPAKFLDGNYTVFGKVVEGMDVLKAIEKGDVVTGITVTHS